jgi:hypothetical protein
MRNTKTRPPDVNGIMVRLITLRSPRAGGNQENRQDKDSAAKNHGDSFAKNGIKS